VKVAFNLLDASIGGGQRVAAGIAQFLIDHGHSVAVVVPDDGPALRWFTDAGVDVQFIELVSLRNPRGVLTAKRFFGEYDLVYSHTSIPGIVLADAAAGRAGVPHVIHQHTPPFFSSDRALRVIQRGLYRRAARRAQTIAVARHVADAAVTAGAPCGRITVIPNGVDVPEPTAQARPRSKLTVGMLGRLDVKKGIDVFLDAVELVTTPMNFELGTPLPEDASGHDLHRRAGKLGVTVTAPASVEFLGGLDVVAVPSREEGHPLTLMEAMVRGKPVVATRIVGIIEMLDGNEPVLLIPTDDPHALAAALDNLATDEERRARLGAQARDFVSTRYALPIVHARVLNFLERAVHE
jgi:glycosyltransferase involved in cell wall biosynthesis